MIDVHINDKPLRDALKDLERRTQLRILKGAHRKAGRPITLDARVKVPKDEGILAKSIGTDVFIGEKHVFQVGKVGKPDEITVRIGPRTSGKYDGYYGDWVEHGTRHAAPHPFMRPAFDANKDRALGILRNEIWERIEKEAKRAAARRRP